ncbi:MAG TPA: DUF3152 domain-containing protein [Candidatus Saccharimonadales bacterium]|nr:DUF3152 domain-containing protein [Candidatus Saccharimonadales bacterium]
MSTERRSRFSSKRPRHRVLWWFFGLAGVLFVANAVLIGVYHNRTYPRTMLVHTAVGNKSFAEVAHIAAAQHIVPQALTLAHASQKVTVSADALGVQFDAARTQQQLAGQRSWLPLVAVFTKHWVPAPVAVSTSQLHQKIPSLASTFHHDATDAHVTLTGTTFNASNPADGYALNTDALPAAIIAAIDHGQTTITVPTNVVSPRVFKTQAAAQAKKLQATLQTSLTYTFGGSNRKPSPHDIAAWYQPDGTTYAPNDFAIRTYIETAGVAMGVHPANLTAAVSTTKQALAGGSSASIALAPFAKTKTYHYCVQTRGNTASYVDSLKAKLANVYTDLRGWSLDGQVEFDYATTACDFTVWLSSADQMSSFGAICDDYWDCEVSNNVVVNLDRWLSTTPSWQAYGGSVDDYRTMLINHETGHMLGFYHWQCPGPAQPAPVMMQESINLGGCVFNIWPTTAELTALRQMIGL